MKGKIILLITILFVVGACAQDKPEFVVEKFTKTDSKKDYVITIRTSMGDMKAILYDETPLHRDNFLELARTGQYDSTTWHRVIDQFMIQGGGVDMKENAVKKNESVPAEFDKRLFHVKGALAAARQGDRVNPKRASSWCQFYVVDGTTFTEEELTIDQKKLNQGFGRLLMNQKYATLREQITELQEKRDFEALNKLIVKNAKLVEEELGISVRKEIAQERIDAYTTLGGTPHLDDTYTVFGQVIDGLEIIDKIAAVKTGGRNKPVEDIFLTIEVEELPKKKITKLYGVVYPKK